MPNFIWPLPLYRAPGLERISDEWGPRNITVPGASTNHRGIDLGWSAGMVYVAAAGGIIIHVGFNGGEGLSIHMRHDDGTVTKYFHSVANSQRVAVGQRVEQGAPLAVVGDTGVSGGPHLHWEIWIGGTQNVNPRVFMAQFAAASLAVTPLLNALRKAKMFILIRFADSGAVFLWNLAPGKDGDRARHVSGTPEPDYARLSAMFGPATDFDSQAEWEAVRTEYNLGN